MPISTRKVSVSSQPKVTNNSGLTDTSLSTSSTASSTSSSTVRSTGGNERNLNENASSNRSSTRNVENTIRTRSESSSLVGSSLASIAEKDAVSQISARSATLAAVASVAAESKTRDLSRSQARKEAVLAEASSRISARLILEEKNAASQASIVSSVLNASSSISSLGVPSSADRVAASNTGSTSRIKIASRTEIDTNTSVLQSLAATDATNNAATQDRVAISNTGGSGGGTGSTGGTGGPGGSGRRTPGSGKPDRTSGDAASRETRLEIPATSADVSITVNSSNTGLASLGMNVQTPEIIGIFDFPTFFDSDNSPTPAAQALDVQYQFKQAGLTSVTNLLAPYASNLAPLQKVYSDGFEDNARALQYYESIKSQIVPLLKIIDFMDSNPQQVPTTVLEDYEKIYYKFEDVYSITRKTLQNFMIEDLKIDERVVRSYRNTAGFLQVAADISSIMLYGYKSLDSRAYSDTSGFKIFGPSASSTGRANLVTTALASLSTSSETPVSVGNILAADIDVISSIVHRQYMENSRTMSVEDAVSEYVTTIAEGDVLLAGSPVSTVASCAFGTQNDGQKYLPLETSIVSRPDVNFRTGREIFINDLLTGATAALSTGETQDYAAEVEGRLMGSNIDSDEDDLVIRIAKYLLEAGSDPSSFPLSVSAIRKCLESFSSMIETYELNQPSARYEALFSINVILLTRRQDFFSRMWQYLCLLATKVLPGSTSSDVAAAETYRLSLIEFIRASVPDTSVDFSSTAEAGALGNQSIVSSSGESTVSSLLESIFPSDGGLFNFIVKAALYYVDEVVSTRPGGAEELYYGTGAGRINLNAVIALCMRVFQLLCETGITLSYVPPNTTSGSETGRPYTSSSRRYNSILFYPDQMNSVKYICDAMVNYTSDSALSSALTSTITDETRLQFSRDFARPIQELLTSIVKQDVCFIYLLRCVAGFAQQMGSIVRPTSSTSTVIPDLNVVSTNVSSQGSDLAALLQGVSTNSSYTSFFSNRVPAGDQAFFVESFSEDQLITSIASNIMLGKRSQDHPFFPVCKVVNAFELQNLKTYLQNLDFRTNAVSDRNRIIAVGLPAGLRSYLRLQNSLSNYGNDAEYQIVIRLFARNQQQDSDPIVIADFKFDTRLFVLGGLSSGDFLNNTYTSLNTLFINTPFKKIKGVNSIEDVYPDASNRDYLINHYNDYYCKLLLRTMIGVDLAEHNFCFDQVNTKNSPDSLKLDSFRALMGDISRKFNGTQEELALFSESIKRTIFFNSLSYHARSIYTKMFDRIFCIPINLDALTFSNSNILLQDIFCVVYLSDGRAPASYTLPLTLNTNININSEAENSSRSGGVNPGTNLSDAQNLFNSYSNPDNIADRFWGTDAGRQLDALGVYAGSSYLPAGTDRAIQAGIEAGMLDESLDRGDMLSGFVTSESILQLAESLISPVVDNSLNSNLLSTFSANATQAALISQQQLLGSGVNTMRDISSAVPRNMTTRYLATTNYYRGRN